MSEWKTVIMICRTCGRKSRRPEHWNCCLGHRGSEVVFNPRFNLLGCTKCKQTWDVEDNLHYCVCGAKEPMEFRDERRSYDYGVVSVSEDYTGMYCDVETGRLDMIERQYGMKWEE